MVLAPGGTTALTAQGANVSVAGTLGVGGAFTAGSGITVSSGNVNLTGVTPSYQIAGVSVLSATTLGAGVLSSSLTGVGTITTGTWQAAVIGTQYGGTGQNFSGTATGSLPYFSSAGTMGALGIGGTGQILTVSGTGAPTWSNAGGNVNFWQENLGALSPINVGDDLLLGATSTSSARFAFTNAVGPGTPTASISGGVNGATYLTAQGIMGTTADQSLTLGALGTGNVVLAPGGTTALTAQGANVSVAGTLGVGGAFTAGSGITVSSGNVNLTGVTPSYQIAGVSVLSATTLGAGVLSSSLTGVGTITTGTWQAAVIGTQYGGTGQNFSADCYGESSLLLLSGDNGCFGYRRYRTDINRFRNRCSYLE